MFYGGTPKQPNIQNINIKRPRCEAPGWLPLHWPWPPQPAPDREAPKPTPIKTSVRPGIHLDASRGEVLLEDEDGLTLIVNIRAPKTPLPYYPLTPKGTYKRHLS